MSNTFQQDIVQPDEEVVRLKRAAEWLQNLEAAPDDERGLAEWLEWCTEDRRNLEAFEQVQQVWLGFGNPPPAQEQTPADVVRVRRTRRAVRKRAQYQWIAAAAAVVALALGVGSSVLYWQPQEIVYSTDVGSQRSEWLPDGSRLDLGGGSRVVVRYTRDRRDVSLEKGEGFFSVAHDTQRPFVVSTGKVEVVAVGTAFDVRMNTENTAVTVAQGRVRIEPTEGADEAHTTFADAGQRVTYTVATRRLAVAKVDPGMAGSWRGGVLNFVAEPLVDVVNDINRYSARKIVIADPDLGQRLFTGSIRQNNVGEWLDALESIFPLAAERNEQNVVLKARARNPAEKKTQQMK